MCNKESKPQCREGNRNAPPALDLRGLFTFWCSILRLPNLLTVPGDPLAGALLAATTLNTPLNWNAVFSCSLASLCLYSAGLLANDFFDRRQDASERPERPLPSGKLQPGPILRSAALLTAGAISFAAQAGWPAIIVASLIALLSWAYNFRLKRIPIVGPLVMGSCRAFSLLLGAAGIAPAAILTPTVLIPAIILGLLITSITNLARRETESIRLPFWQIALPPATLLIGLSFIILIPQSPRLINHPLSSFSLLLTTMPIIWTTLLAAQLLGRPSPVLVQRNIGGMIRGLLLFQAALCASTGGIGDSTALFILAAFPVTGWLGRCFQGS